MKLDTSVAKKTHLKSAHFNGGESIKLTYVPAEGGVPALQMVLGSKG